MLDISKRKQKEALESKHQTELEALNRIVNILQFTHTSSEALPALMHETLKALDVTDGCILLYQPKTGELHMTVASGWFEKYQDLVVKPGKGISSAVLESGKTYISDDFSKDPQIYVSNAPPDWAGACVPIHSQDSVIGVLFVSCKLPRTIQPHEVQLLEAIAQIAGISLHRTKLLENTKEQLDNLEAHLTINEAIAHLHNIDLTLEIICKKSLDILSADAIRILLFTATDHKLHHKINEGFCDEHNQKAPLMLGEGCAGKAALERKFFLIDNLENCDPPFEDQALAAKEGFIAYAALPMIAKGKLIGMFEIFHRRPFDHDSVWLSQASSMALKTAVAIDDLQIYNQIKLTNLNLQQAFDSTIEGWSQALEIRDRETEGHTLRVTEMTVQLAKALGTADDEIIHIRRGALLHDVGKLGIPDHILQKPGPLTDDEWEIMKKHPDYAYHMLSPISYLRQAIDIPYCHHEKWDGSGYPRGLKGRQIPLAARIFTVIDVWDAISADRPYDNAWPEGDVLDYLRAQSGKQFDPEVVSVFLKMITGNNHR